MSIHRDALEGKTCSTYSTTWNLDPLTNSAWILHSSLFCWSHWSDFSAGFNKAFFLSFSRALDHENQAHFLCIFLDFSYIPTLFIFYKRRCKFLPRPVLYWVGEDTFKKYLKIQILYSHTNILTDSTKFQGGPKRRFNWLPDKSPGKWLHCSVAPNTRFRLHWHCDFA